MALQPGIILAGQPADVPGSFAQGVGMSQKMRGNEIALQDAKDQSQRQRDYMEARRALALIDRAQTPEMWDQIASRVSPELVGQFAKRDAIRAAVETTIDALDPRTADETKVMKAADGSIVQLVPDGAGGYTVKALTEGEGPKETALEARARLAGLQPGTPEFQNFMLQGGGARGSTLTLPDGTRVDLFGGAGGELGKAAQNELDEKAINAAEVLTGLTQVEEAFDPKFLEYETRFGTAFSRLKDRMGTASPEDKAAITEFANFKRRSLDLLSKQLNALSGAAVSPQEFQRISATLPNAGSGLFDGDSPAEFEAKMRDSILQMRLATARYQIWKSRGGIGGPEEITRMASLENPDKIIAMRIDMIENQLRSQGVTDRAEIDAIIDNQIREEFGL